MNRINKTNTKVNAQNGYQNRQRKRNNTNKPNNNSNIKVTEVGKGIREVGQTLGGLFGMGKAGRALAAGVSRIFGQGDYQMNAVNSNTLAGGVPSFSPLTSGFRIKHREYITDISSSVAYASQVYPINPGLNKTFPWLSQVAANFEEYKIHGMVVYLNTMAGASVSSANNGLGLWGVVTQYDPTEPDFTTKQQAEAYVGAQSAVPSQSLLHGIECAPKANILEKLNVRSGAQVSGEDLKFYDWGKVQVFTQGSQGSNTIGEMWISYDIEFTKPRLPTGGYVAYADKYKINGGSQGPYPFPTIANLVPSSVSNMGTSFNGNNGAMTVPSSVAPGTYLLLWISKYAAATTGIQQIGFGPNFNTVIQWQTMAGAIALGPENPISSVQHMAAAIFTKTANVADTITFSTNNVVGSTNAASHDILLVQLPALMSVVGTEPKAVLDDDETALLKKLVAKFSKEGFFKQIEEELKEEDEPALPVIRIEPVNAEDQAEPNNNDAQDQPNPGPRPSDGSRVEFSYDQL